MRIAIFGWGSLVWDPRSLRVRTRRWRRDGPRLPIEFARVSSGPRLTLVILPESELQRTYWTLSELDVIEEARVDLARREGRPDRPAPLEHIHWAARDGSGVRAGVGGRVHEWLAEHADVDAAVWTGLPPEGLEGSNVVDAAVAYLTGLDPRQHEAARLYVERAPPQIQTPVRRAMQQRGWADAELGPELLDDD